MIEKLRETLRTSWFKKERADRFGETLDSRTQLSKKIKQIRSKSGFNPLRTANKNNKKTEFHDYCELAVIKWNENLYNLGCRFFAERPHKNNGFLIKNPCYHPGAISNIEFEKIRYIWIPQELAVLITTLEHIP